MRHFLLHFRIHTQQSTKKMKNFLLVSILAMTVMSFLPRTTYGSTTTEVEGGEQPHALPVTAAEAQQNTAAEVWQEDDREVLIRSVRGAKNNNGANNGSGSGKKEKKRRVNNKKKSDEKVEKKTRKFYFLFFIFFPYNFHLIFYFVFCVFVAIIIIICSVILLFVHSAFRSVQFCLFIIAICFSVQLTCIKRTVLYSLKSFALNAYNFTQYIQFVFIRSHILFRCFVLFFSSVRPVLHSFASSQSFVFNNYVLYVCFSFLPVNTSTRAQR